MRHALLPLALALLTAPSAVGAAWLQEGVDASRSGDARDPGPEWGDVAWVAQLGGSLFSGEGAGHGPLILDGAIYALVTDRGHPGLDERAIYRIDVDTGTATRLLAFDDAPDAFASDGAHLFVAFPGRVEAYPLGGGAPVWTRALPTRPGTPAEDLRCGPPAVGAGQLILGCEEDASVSGLALGSVTALDAATGEPRWTWYADSAAFASRAGLLLGPTGPPLPIHTRIMGVSLVGPFVLAAAQEYHSAAAGAASVEVFENAYRFSVWSLDAATGELLWGRNTSELGGHRVACPSGCTGDIAGRNLMLTTFATGTRGVAYLKLDELLAVNPARGNVLWRADIGSGDAVADDGGAGFAMVGTELTAASFQTLYHFDTVAQEPVWSFNLDPAREEAWDSPSLVAAGDVVLGMARALSPPRNGTLYAVHRETGDERWSLTFASRDIDVDDALFRFSVGEGVIAVAGTDGTLRLIGRTSASIALPDEPTQNAYPAPGETVRVDLSGGAPGALGAATEWRVDWGDGSVDEWRADPVFEHAYARGGDVEARFHARNAAGQSASRAQTFHVGTPAPNFISEAFSRENQETTFFLLGLVLTGGGGLYGLTRFRARRGRLKRELDALERAYEAAKAQPAECEAALQERRVHVRALLLDGKLDEGQHAVLERRIEALLGRVRMAQVDRRFHFLPYGMVMTLQEMLRDGRVNAWEREHFLDALEREEHLTPEHKAKVRALIEQWYARDDAH